MRERVYKSIKAYIKINGYAPTLQEIGSMVGLKSKSSVWEYLRTLRELGYISFEDGKARTIRIEK